LALATASVGRAHDLSIQFDDSVIRYSVDFNSGGIHLTGNEFSLRIEDRDCSKKQIAEFKDGLSHALERHKFRKAKLENMARLAIQGVVSRIPVNDRLANSLRRVPFDLFTLRQITDRSCRQTRAVASETVADQVLKIIDISKPTEKCAMCEALAGLDYKDDARSCIESLCTDPSFSNQKLTEEATKLDAFQDPVFKKDFLPLIDQILELEKKQREQKADLTKQIKSGIQFSQKSEVALLNYFRNIMAIPYDAFTSNDNALR